MILAAPSVTRQLVEKYMEPARGVVEKLNRPYGSRRSLAEKAEISMLAALFAHVRSRPHAEPVSDLEGELSASLKEKEIVSILEVGGGAAPFARFLAPCASPETFFFTFDRNGTDKFSDRHLIRGQGDVDADLPDWWRSIDFDLILAFGLYSYGGWLPLDELPAQVESGSRSALGLIKRLSDNPHAAAIFSAWNIDLLAFERSQLEKEARVILWERFDYRLLPTSYQGNDWPVRFLKTYPTQPVSLAMLGRPA